METVAIIAEYNPFHQGHAHQIAEVKRRHPQATLLVLMSGEVVQRGEFAVAPKGQRATWALAGGADLVCELPYIYAGQTAEIFGAGAVSILHATGVCQHLCFGTESQSIAPLEAMAQVLATEPPAYKAALRDALNEGLSFARARQQALGATLGDTKALTLPNNILAVEYLKALKRLNSSITPMAILRKGSGYHSTHCHPQYPSASALRLALKTTPATPPQGIVLTAQDWSAMAKTANTLSAAYQTLVLAKVLTASPESLRTYPDVSPGLEFALKNASAHHHTLEALLGAVTSKVTTTSRVRRILMALATEYKAEDFTRLSQGVKAPYLRVLAFNQRGRALLRTIKKTDGLPVITNVHSNRKALSPIQREVLDWDIRTANLGALLRGAPQAINGDYRHFPLGL